MNEPSDLRTLRVLLRLPPRLLRVGRGKPKLPAAIRAHLGKASRAELQLLLIVVIARLEGRDIGRRRTR